MLGRVREVVLAADDVGDRHRRVVDDDREVVERRAVAADDDEVAAEVRDIDLDVTADDVVEGDDALADPEPQRAATALGLVGRALLRRSGVAQRPTYFGGSLAASCALRSASSCSGVQ